MYQWCIWTIFQFVAKVVEHLVQLVEKENHSLMSVPHYMLHSNFMIFFSFCLKVKHIVGHPLNYNLRLKSPSCRTITKIINDKKRIWRLKIIGIKSFIWQKFKFLQHFQRYQRQHLFNIRCKLCTAFNFVEVTAKSRFWIKHSSD